jgi:diguanylate cyclase (GGDEF)-like protein
MGKARRSSVAETGFSAKTVLIVDDDPSRREGLRKTLSNQSFLLQVASSGQEALSASHRLMPDLILMETQMDNLNGFEVSARLRSLPNISEIPVILLHTHESLHVRKLGFESGADDLLSRATDPEELIARVLATLSVNRFQRLCDERARFEGFVRLCPSGVLMLDSQGLVMTANQIVAEMMGVEHCDELIGVSASTLMSPRAQPFDDMLNDVFQTTEPVRGTSILLGVGGREVPVELCLGTSSWRGSRCVQMVITEALQEFDTPGIDQDKDGLTNLGNRSFLLRLLETMPVSPMGAARGLLLIDIDHFRQLTETLSHVDSDKVLLTFAQRLQHVATGDDVVCRITNDEFVLVRSCVDGLADLERLARAVQEALLGPIEIPGQGLRLTTSIGCVFDPERREGVQLLQDAAAAVFEAKTSGRARIVTFTESMRERAAGFQRVKNYLPLAITNDELELQYQPIFSLLDHTVRGFEALLRWKDPRSGLVEPSEFIPIAEQTGIMSPIDSWVLERACRDFCGWIDNGYIDSDLTLSVNFSAQQFCQPHFVEKVEKIMGETGMDPSRLRFEITETVLLSDPSANQGVFQRLSDMGIRLHIDDFGTGYCSFTYLTQLPIGALKVDRAFTSGVHNNERNLEIVRSIINLADNLGMLAIAEGIETEEHLNRLVSLGCTLGQGFYLSRPLDEDCIPDVVSSYTSEASVSELGLLPELD